MGLAQTSVPAGSPDLPEPFLSGTTKQGEPEGTVKNATNWNPSWAFTAGEMVCTLDDLHKWGVALGSGEGVFNAESQLEREASKVSKAKGDSPTSTYALGFGVKNGWMGHTGTLPGYNTDLNYDPKTKTTVVVMVNSDIPLANGKLPANAIFDGLVAAMPKS